MKTIKYYFLQDGRSYDKICKEHGIGKSYLNRIVNGKVCCTMEHFIRLASWLKMPKDEAAKEWEHRKISQVRQQVKDINE